MPVYIPIHVFVILYKSNELNKRAAQNEHTLTSSASNGIKMYVIDLPKPVGNNAKTSFFSKILNKTLCCSSFNLISNLNYVKTFANVLLYISSIVEERCKHDLIWAYANKHLNDNRKFSFNTAKMAPDMNREIGLEKKCVFPWDIAN